MNPTEQSEIAQIIKTLPCTVGTPYTGITKHALVCELSRLFYSWDKTFNPEEFFNACEGEVAPVTPVEKLDF